ncbi:lipoprotein releasing system transmembrane protein LolE [Photobacterium aphoticum]|uniref:Lipoprotein releasing system transmembrane protein LolE n=1 Tax=Photobacterium aphoticum TaxID=754436 RepID=A0A090QPP6_9GAMM|nr:lipoprotein releasing system transmembrane protein LolE [Photobacterium aphoticum]
MVRSIFIWHGIFSGVIGSLIGSLLGSLVAVNLTSMLRGLEQIVGHKFLSGDVYFVDFLPTQLAVHDVVLVTVTAVVLSFLATWYPAKRASALQPAAVLSAK